MRFREGTALALLLFIFTFGLTLTACSGHTSTGAGLTGTATETLAGNPEPATMLTGLPGLPGDSYIDPEVIINRRGAEIYSREILASDFFGVNPLAVADDSTGTLRFYPGPGGHGLWALYRFADVLATDNPLYLETSFDTETLPKGLWIGISDYESGTWHWVADEHPGGRNAAAIPADLQAISPGGAIYFMVAIEGTAPSLLESLTLHLDTGQLPPPVGLTASQGVDGDSIQLTWDDPTVTYGVEYIGVQIDRALDLGGPWTAVASEPVGIMSHWDTVSDIAGSGQEVYYRLRTVSDEQAGWQSPAATGWTAAGPIECLAVNANIHDYIELNWDNSDPDVIGYNIYYRRLSETEPAPWTLLGNLGPDVTQLTHTSDNPPGMGCELNTTYEYYLKTNYSSGEWTFSNRVTRLRTLQPVHFFRAGKGCYPNQIKLEFYDDGQLDELDGYVIDYRNKSGGTPADWTRLTEIEDSLQHEFLHNAVNPPGMELELDTEYEYRIYPTWQEYQGLIPVEDYGYSGIGGGEWRMEGHDRRHTRRSPAVGPVDRELKWEQDVEFVYKYNGVVGHDDSVFVGTYVGGVALAPDGNYKWYTENSTAWSTAIAPDGTVYTAKYGKGIDAYSPAGELLWTNDTAASVYDGALVLDDDGTIITGNKAGTLYAINPDGSDKFEYSSSGEINWSPAIADDGTIYFTREIDETENYLTAVNLDGTWKWDYSLLAATPMNAPSVGDTGVVYLSTFNGLIAISPDGSLAWVFEPGVQFNTNPAIAADGTLYAGTEDGRLFAISPEGERNWAFEAFSVTGTKICSSPAIDGAGNIYFASYYGSLYCLGPDAEVLWRYDTGTRQVFSPVIADSGTVYILCNLVKQGFSEPRTYLLAFGPGE